MKRFYQVLLLGSVAFAVATLSCSRRDSVTAGQLTKVQKLQVVKSALVAGRLEAAEQVQVESKIPGKIKVIHAKVGSQVALGDVLLEFDEAQLQMEVDKANNQINSRKTELVNLELQHQAVLKRKKRAELLVNQKIAPAKDLEDANRDLTVFENNMSLKQAEMKTTLNSLVQQAGLMEHRIVKSPVAGLVTTVAIDASILPGDLTVRTGAKLFTIAKTDGLVLNGNLPETDIASINVGVSAVITLDAIAGTRFTGKVEKVAVAPVMDPQSGVPLFPVRIRVVENDPRFRTGMMAQGLIEIAKRPEVIALPLNAVKTDGLSDFVEVVANGVAAIRPVKLGLSSEFLVEILSGLKEGEEVKVP